jgi:methylphosphotriester-DNA--protein-cysteine methyltransferase
LETPPSPGDREVDRVLAVLAAGQVASNTAAATACGRSVRTIRDILKAQTGGCTTTWRRLARGKRFVGLLVNTRNNIGQCADDLAGYRYGRESVAECRRLFGRTPTEIRRLLSL